ncbi:hypothetical protein PVAND_017164 [Polypedilum vanderplanki]|uniref:Gustatory receptor n=1 Tax=Polypedilum vanderplanki TaxID=319348 RepID=A0A9J6BHU0_POLVA|nr:hypothetical protein PVAND_017164 [Polypedilum vanderplanki]
MNQVLSTIKPIYFVAKFFGFFTTKFTENGIKVTKVNFIYAALMSFTIITIFKLRYDLAISNPWYDSPLVFLGFKARQYFGIIGIILIFFGNFIYRNSYLKILETVTKIDQKLADVDLNFNYKKHKIFVIKVLVFLFLSLSLIISANCAVIKIFGPKNTNVLLEIKVWGGLFVTVAVTAFHMVFYCVIVIGIKARFGKINEGLKNLIRSENQRKILEPTNVSTIEKITKNNDNFQNLPPNYSETKQDLKKNSHQIFKKPSVTKPYQKTLQILSKNQKLEQIPENSKKVTKLQQNLKSKSVKIFTNVHLQLCEILKVINFQFLLVNTCFVALNLIAMIFVFFQIFVFARSSVKKSARQMNNLMLSTLWNIFVTFKIAAVTGACAATSREGKKSEKILFEILHKENDEKVAIKLRIFVLQLKHLKPSFSCGLFEYDLGLICMISLLGLKIDKNKIKKISIISTCVLILSLFNLSMIAKLNFTILLANDTDFIYQFYSWFGSVTSITNGSIFMTFVCIIIHGIYERLKRFKEITKINQKFLKEISKLHLKLTKIVDLINLVFIFPIAIVSASNLIGMTFMCFQVIECLILGHFDPRLTATLILVATWNGFLCIVIMIVFIICAKSTNEEKICSEKFYKILRKENDEKLRKKLRIFMQQLKHKKIIFSCGLFDFQYEVILMYFGFLLSYLIVLIQFRISSIM